MRYNLLKNLANKAPNMDTKHSREHFNPFRKKFVSPQGNRKSQKSPGISPKLRANMKDFHKFPQQNKKDANPKKKLWEIKKGKNVKYHLGGNSCDPLNLNSLIDRDPTLNTPQASPHPMHGDSPIEICPHDYKDPLNLKGFPQQAGKEGPTPKKRKKKKHKNRHNDIENNEEKIENKETGESEKSKEKKKKKKSKKVKSNASEILIDKEEQPLKSDLSLKIKVAETDRHKESEISEDDEPPKKKKKLCSENVQGAIAVKDEMVEKNDAESPKLDLKSQDKSQTIPKHSPISKQKTYLGSKKKDSKKNQKVFIYGNYNRYYNYRNPHCSEDIRLKNFRKEWFCDKDVLDIGCNVGNVTFGIAQQYGPRIIIGNDIDNALIKIAKTNAQIYAHQTVSSASSSGGQFPLSFAVTNGPIAAPILLTNDNEQEKLKFPKNVIFKQENYVPPDENSLANQRPMFDTILCLSVTKWVHLNWGDQGLKLMFKKIFRNLRPGGRLILEPQPFASYNKRKKLTEKIRANYDSICFRPEQFVDYLLSEEIGFVAYEVLEEPQQGAQGFRRPMYLFTKATNKTNQTPHKTVRSSH